MAAGKADSFFNLTTTDLSAWLSVSLKSGLPMFLLIPKNNRTGPKAARQKAILAIFPELGLSAYSNDDLFHKTHC